MTIYEYGKENDRHVVLIHPSLVLWDYFERVIPYLEKDYHVIVPALPGYDEKTGEDFTSVEQIADDLAGWLNQKGFHRIACLYGCSMGGAVVAKMLSERKVDIENAVLDGGITPYQLPWILTRFIVLRDFCMIALGKIGGIKLLEKAFSTDEYSHEDLQYIANNFKWITYRTIWRTFDSCNNYSMHKPIRTDCRSIQYWFGSEEEKERKWDIDYMRKNFPGTKFVRMKNLGHAGMALLRPREFSERIKRLCSREV